jgi:uncharacterized membrane protein YeiB
MHEQSPELKRGGRIGPVGESKRVAAMDVIRGVALFGILAVNMDFFAGPFAAMFSDETAWTVSGLDAAAFWTVATVFQGKFISLFSFLFGAGIALQLLRLDETRGGMAANLLLLRRLFVLGAFGLIHATLIWYGDILFIYARLGLATPSLPSPSRGRLARRRDARGGDGLHGRIRPAHGLEDGDDGGRADAERPRRRGWGAGCG